MKKAAREGCFLEFGAGNRSRTYDLRITNALLYQLSYAGKTICFRPGGFTPPFCTQNIFVFFQFAALFMGPDLERPKSYQSFFLMGNQRCKTFKKKRDLHRRKFSFIITFLAVPR